MLSDEPSVLRATRGGVLRSERKTRVLLRIALRRWRGAKLEEAVAFTPKGGCPLKRACTHQAALDAANGSIHPQGWVPIETALQLVLQHAFASGSIHPQGWVPIETNALPILSHAFVE